MKMAKYKLKITFWNENDDLTKEIIIDTDYPEYCDVEETLYINELDDFKDDGGNFDYFEREII